MYFLLPWITNGRLGDREVGGERASLPLTGATRMDRTVSTYREATHGGSAAGLSFGAAITSPAPPALHYVLVRRRTRLGEPESRTAGLDD